uniref:Uncharacterized protein n=1 Tax=Peronospora matthiolae TaxID=2874970 RepID=A0AAV1UE10_9STRA
MLRATRKRETSERKLPNPATDFQLEQRPLAFVRHFHCCAQKAAESRARFPGRKEDGVGHLQSCGDKLNDGQQRTRRESKRPVASVDRSVRQQYSFVAR